MTVIFKAGLNGDVLWDSSKPSVTERILSPKCKVEVNKAASASFVIFSSHPLYGSLEKMKTLVTIEIDGRLVFRGRVIDIQTDIYKQRSVTCEGDYAFLLDTVQPPIKGSYSPTQLLTNLIQNHNEKVEDWKKFTVGTVSITEATKAKQIDASGYAKTSDVINSELLQEYGGIIRTRFEDGVAYIDYVEDPFTQPIETINAQQIKYGINLVDFNEQYPINDLFTVLLPTGKDDMTIASVNDGSPYLISQEAVDAFGWICHTESWSHIDNATELKNTAQTYLNGHARKFPNDLTVRAVDLKMLSDGYEEFKMGDMVRVSIPHLQEDEILYCLSIDYDFQNPGSTSYRLGTFIPSDKQKGSTLEQSGGCGGGGAGSEPTASSQAARSSSGGRRSAAGVAAAAGEIEEIKEWRSEFTDEETGYKSVIKQTADKIYGTVENTKKELIASISLTDGKIASEVTSRNEALEGLRSSIEQSLGSITATVKDNSEHISTISAKLNSITLSVSNGDTESTITLKAGEAAISSEKITFTGMVTLDAFNALSGSVDSLVSGRTVADKLAASTVSATSLDVTGTATLARLKMGDHSFSPHTISMAVGVGSGEVLAVGDIKLDHSHGFTFDVADNGDVTGTVGNAQSAQGTDSFNIASTTFHKKKVAEAETKGQNNAKQLVSLIADGWTTGGTNTIRDSFSTKTVVVNLPTFTGDLSDQWTDAQGTGDYSKQIRVNWVDQIGGTEHLAYSGYIFAGEVYEAGYDKAVSEHQDDYETGYNAGLANAKTRVTLSASGWDSNRTNTVTDSFSGKTCPVTLPNFTSALNPTWSGNNTWSSSHTAQVIVSYLVGETKRTATTYIVDASSVYSSGVTSGYNSGKTEGYNQGRTDGYSEGRTDGYNSGWSAGYNRGYAEGKAAGGAAEAFSKIYVTSTSTAVQGKYVSVRTTADSSLVKRNVKIIAP